jgi:hypothetical protein
MQSTTVAFPDYMKAPEILRLELLSGIYTRIARKTGNSRGHVRRVALGERKSARIQVALSKEFERIDRKVRMLEQKTLRVAA